MKSLKTLTFALAAICAFAHVQQVRSIECPPKFVCPNTTVTGDLNNPVILIPVQRQLIRDFYNSALVQNNSHISKAGLRFIDKLLYYVNTDSPSFLDVLYRQLGLLLPYLLAVDQYPQMCNLARNINASVAWHKEKDGHAAADALTEASDIVITSCSTNAYITLTGQKCKDLTPPTPVDIRCHERGEVYDIEDLLAISGRFLPCSIKYFLLDMYDSKDYLNKVLVTTFIASLAETTKDVYSAHYQNVIVETINLGINPKISICCCEHRRNRWAKLCAYHDSLAASNVKYLIKTKYLAPECKK